MKQEGLVCLSLFDGISCGQVALERAGIKVDKYYASEIDKYAIQVSQSNYPSVIQLGDIHRWQEWDVDFKEVDLILAGFPCQSWSVAGKQLGDKDERGSLFWVMLDIIESVKAQNPKVLFILENVKMKQDFQDYLTSALQERVGTIFVTPINSSLVSGQNRNRLYWTNFEVSTLPDDKGILLKDIVHEGEVDREKSYCIDANYYKGGNLKSYFEKSRRQLVFEWLDKYKVPFNNTLKILNKEVEKGKIGYFRSDSQANRVYTIHGKSVTLCGDAGGGAAKMGQYLFGCITPDRVEKRQNGQRFNNGVKSYTLTAQDKHGILTEGYIRKLTPVECERLQTLPRGYTEGISETQRYKVIGNGWTVDVIVHILSYAKRLLGHIEDGS